MKPVCQILSALLIFYSLNFGQWHILNKGVKGTFNAIDFIDENTGWIAGHQGQLLKTVDGGQSWKSLAQDVNWHFQFIDFITDSIGWAVISTSNGYCQWIIKTTDGGRSWIVTRITECSSSVTTLEALFVISDSIVYTLDWIAILKTMDAGVTWENITPDNNDDWNYHTAWFFNADSGFIGGDYLTDDKRRALLLQTCDGGRTWIEKSTIKLPPIHELQFINDSTAYFRDINADRLYKTENAFATWPQTDWALAKIYSYFVLNDSTVFAVDQGRGGVIKSTNSGVSWENIFGLNWNFDKVYFSSTQIGFFIGGSPYGGSVFRTTDGGETWQSQLLSYPFHDIDFINKDTGFACGGLDNVHFSRGNLLITNDGGQNWRVILETYNVLACQFITDMIGFVLPYKNWRGPWSRQGSILKTNDGGNTFINVLDSIGWDFSGNDLCFLDENQGWIAGFGIITTSDGGESWKNDTILFKNNQDSSIGELYSITLLNDSAGWAVGDSGTILKLKARGQWQKQKSITDLPLLRIYFLDNQTGFISAGYQNWQGYQSKFFKTVDSGESWRDLADIPCLIHDVYFIDLYHGWAVGSDKDEQGIILATEDRGDNWFIQKEGLIGPLRALDYCDGYLLASGKYSLVLRLDLTTTVEADSRQIMPLEFKLFQNYPNPFNAVTSIEYQVSSASEVELNIYNILGQKVVALISGRQQAGQYQVIWDAGGLSSGIYYYRLQAGGYTEVRKCLLLR